MRYSELLAKSFFAKAVSVAEYKALVLAHLKESTLEQKMTDKIGKNWT